MKENPLSPHLQVYKWQLSSLLSITHRITLILNIFSIFIILLFISFDNFSNRKEAVIALRQLQMSENKDAWIFVLE